MKPKTSGADMEAPESLIPVLTAFQLSRERIRSARGVANLKPAFLEGALAQGVGIVVGDGSGQSYETYELSAEDTRLLARDGLSYFIQHATQILDDLEERLRQLLRMDNAIDVKSLLTVMATSESEYGKAREAAGYFVIEKLGSGSGGAIEAALFDPDENIRFQAAHVLRFVRTERTVDCLLRALGDSDGDVRAMTAAALARHGEARAVLTLQKLAETDSAPGVRKTAADALQAIQSGQRGTKFF